MLIANLYFVNKYKFKIFKFNQTPEKNKNVFADLIKSILKKHLTVYWKI